MKNITFLIVSALVFAFYSCGRKGCTDPNATNYDAAAVKNDGYCIYPFGNPLIKDSLNPDDDGTGGGAVSFTAIVDGVPFVANNFLATPFGGGIYVGGSIISPTQTINLSLDLITGPQPLNSMLTQWSPDGSTIYEAYQGEADMSSFANNKVSGSFYFSAAYNGDTVHITNGVFTNIPY